MRKFFFLLALAPACVGGHDEPTVHDNLGDSTTVWVESPVQLPVRHVPACEQLVPTVGDCCVLACSDPELFRETCGRAGECVDFACPLMDGSFLTPGVCEP